jgi:hypothetical protein
MHLEMFRHCVDHLHAILDCIHGEQCHCEYQESMEVNNVDSDKECVPIMVPSHCDSSFRAPRRELEFAAACNLCIGLLACYCIVPAESALLSGFFSLSGDRRQSCSISLWSCSLLSHSHHSDDCSGRPPYSLRNQRIRTRCVGHTNFQGVRTLGCATWLLT